MAKASSACLYVVYNAARGTVSEHSTVRAAKKAAKRLSLKKRDRYAGITRFCGAKKIPHFIDCWDGVCGTSRKKRGRKNTR